MPAVAASARACARALALTRVRAHAARGATMQFGDAEGGYADLAQLQLMLDSARPALDDDAQQEKVRWAALQICCAFSLSDRACAACTTAS